MGVDHYENFPVASVLLPARLRTPVRVLYRFARTADDLADEGDAPATARLAALSALGHQLDAIAAGRANDWPDLAHVVRAYELPLQPLHELLAAFTQDVTTARYATDGDLLDYCRRSANPIGRLLLVLYGRSEPSCLAQSDAICTGLQLTNFWQDIAIDWAKGRVYIPRERLARHGVREEAIAAGVVDAAWRALMSDLVGCARAHLLRGAPLAQALGGRIGAELRFIVQGGLRILARIEAVGGDVFNHRPTLGTSDWIAVAARAAWSYTQRTSGARSA